MRFIQLALAATALTAASAAYAAGATASTPAPPSPPSATNAAAHATTDYKARCSALESQWETTMTAQATNPNLGKAKSKAAKAKTNCASSKEADQKKGVTGYESALKLLGATPS